MIYFFELGNIIVKWLFSNQVSFLFNPLIFYVDVVNVYQFEYFINCKSQVLSSAERDQIFGGAGLFLSIALNYQL